MSDMQTYFAHSHALVESETIGEGTRIWAFAHVMSGAVIGSHCNVGDHAFIESGARVGNNVTIKNSVSIWDGVTLEDNVFVGPNAVFTNDMNPRSEVKKSPAQLLATVVRSGATIGANATVVCGITIGRYAFLGAGTVVLRNVPAYAMMVGNPARRIAFMCECGERLPETLACACGRQYQLQADPAAGLLRV